MMAVLCPWMTSRDTLKFLSGVMNDQGVSRRTASEVLAHVRASCDAQDDNDERETIRSALEQAELLALLRTVHEAGVCLNCFLDPL